jgi:hypothetical protein
VVDAEHRIIYVNPALKQMFNEVRSGLRHVLPALDPATLEGQSADVVALNAAEQRALLQSLRGSHTVESKFGELTMKVTSTPVHVYDGDVLPPLTSGVFNLVQRNQVVPVKITIGCNGFLSGLHPAISIRAGAYDAGVDPSDPSYVVPDTSSSADTSGVMREGDGQYLYNLGVPSNASAGQLYTVLVRPFGGTTPTLYAVLKIRR